MRSERVAIRRKGGRTAGGCGWGWVCLSECESCRGMVLRKSSHGFASVARASGFGRCVVVAIHGLCGDFLEFNL